MKRRDLIQYLQRNGCELLREGARHSIYKSIAGGSLTVVPRHREIKDLLVKKICRDLEIPQP